MSSQRTEISNRLLGQYQAEVVDVSHPDDLYLARVRLLGLWTAIKDYDLPWAEFLLPIGAKPKAGEVIPVEVGDLVWVDFPRNGDTRYPRITGSLYHAPDYTSNLPDEVNGVNYEPKRADGEPTPPAYTRKDYLYDRWGFREHRTVNGGWSVTHKGTGTAIELTEEGELVVHVEGESFESATGKKTEQYKDALSITVIGPCDIKTDDAMNFESGKDMTFKAGGNVNLESGGDFAVKAKAAPWKLG